MKASIHNLIKEFKDVASEKIELEFRDMAELKALLEGLASQFSLSDK